MGIAGGRGALGEGLGSSFANNIDDVLTKQGLSIDEFNSLRLQDVSTLTDAQKATLKTIRERVPMPADSVSVIRYTTDEVSKISIPYSKELGGMISEKPPFTGNGFTKVTNGEITPVE